MKTRHLQLLLGAGAVLAVLGVWLSNPAIAAGVTWPVAFLLAVIVVSAAGLAGWALYLRNRYTDEPED
ncbi:hypothetical protein [Micromonospora sp. WMMD736]|uniref:hypothetical protein n=1 Tax=Micromonospora sp. WMMD736 TaxID=3404112 RepID=UPI003B928096